MTARRLRVGSSLCGLVSNGLLVLGQGKAAESLAVTIVCLSVCLSGQAISLLHSTLTHDLMQQIHGHLSIHYTESHDN